MRVRIVMTGGGTGGHVYPALSIIQCLSQRRSRGVSALSGHERMSPAASYRHAAPPGSAPPVSADAGLVYMGSSRGMERTLVPGAGVRCFFFPMAPPSTPRGVLLLALATARSVVTLLRIRPRVTFATGGYASTPAAVASWLLRIPIILFLPDIVPGKAVRFLIPLCRRIAATTEASLPYLPRDKTTVTGYPVRESFRTAARGRARESFGLPATASVLCVFGASQGARSINQAVAAHLPHILGRCHVIHICGEQRLKEAEEAAGSLTAEQRRRYRLFPFLHDQAMADALVASDLVLCRSGASVLGELPATGTPAVLAPLPLTAVHQGANAEYLAKNGAAVIVEDALLGERLTAVLDELLSDRARLERMRVASRALDRPGATEAIISLIEDAV